MAIRPQSNQKKLFNIPWLIMFFVIVCGVGKLAMVSPGYDINYIHPGEKSVACVCACVLYVSILGWPVVSAYSP